ncbi:uncharacterized protein LOC127594419 [Hippocampus zosterae]|uniref:uncharacterized protein LOC127594419 n=1 Tax=Hippocampus zosterae TaxID=109293 RepID=UPI00223DF0EA|nr:uncharacterized protein LOC127594419 [Hippocampus zosterae]
MSKKVEKKGSEKLSEKGSVKDLKPSKAFDPNKYAKTGIPVATISKMKDCFDLFDRDSSGSMSPDELISGLMALGIEEEANKICTLVRSISADRGIEEIDFENFVTMFCSPSTGSDERTKTVFKEYDKLKERYTDPEIELMLYHADKDKDGHLTYEEFEAVLKKYGR